MKNSKNTNRWNLKDGWKMVSPEPKNGSFVSFRCFAFLGDEGAGGVTSFLVKYLDVPLEVLGSKVRISGL